MRTFADESWAEDNEGSAALLRQHAACAISLVPGVLVSALRADVTTVRLIDPPTRGIYALLPRRDQHPATPLLTNQLTKAFASPG